MRQESMLLACSSQRGFMSRITAILCRHEVLYRRGNVRRRRGCTPG
ncbi:MAG: hypothetical protein WAV24_05820 [Methanothrix sp.]